MPPPQRLHPLLLRLKCCCLALLLKHHIHPLDLPNSYKMPVIPSQSPLLGACSDFLHKSVEYIEPCHFLMTPPTIYRVPTFLPCVYFLLRRLYLLLSLSFLLTCTRIFNLISNRRRGLPLFNIIFKQK